jgi:hypothetical protein
MAARTAPKPQMPQSKVDRVLVRILADMVERRLQKEQAQGKQ